MTFRPLAARRGLKAAAASWLSWGPFGGTWLGGAVATNALLLVVVVGTGCDALWATVLFAWVNLLLYVFLSQAPNAFLGAFLFSYGLLLLTQGTFERMFGWTSPNFEPAAPPTTAVILLLGLAGIAAGYFGMALARRLLPLAATPTRSRPAPKTRTLFLLDRVRIRKSARFVVIAMFPIAALWLLTTVMTSGISAYAESYTEDFIAQSQSPLQFAGMYATDITSVALAIYLASFPTRKDARLPIILAGAVQVLYLLVGVRRDFTLFVMLLICYALIRNRTDPEEPWLPRSWIPLILVGGAALLPVFTLTEQLRGLGESGNSFDFLYNQGVSVRVIDNTVSFGELVPNQFYLAEFARSGLLARFLGFPILQGNSVERAMTGGSFSHALSLPVLGENAYLSGVTTGTSFLAEGYIQYGLLGVLLVTAVTGALLWFVDQLSTGRALGNAIRLLIAPSLLWTPRGTSTGFLAILVATPTLLVLVVIFGILGGAEGVSQLRRLAPNPKRALPGHAEASARVAADEPAVPPRRRLRAAEPPSPRLPTD